MDEVNIEKHEYLRVNINDLYPDPENYRFDPVNDVNEAILYMVNEIYDKLLVLIRSIIENNGIDPSILPNIVPYKENSNKYIVIEGNRRITAIKIIKNVDLIKESIHYQKFKTLISKYDTTRIPNEYLCVYYSVKTDAQYWVYLRHGGELKGEGLMPWTSLAIQRYKVSTGQEKGDISFYVNDYLRLHKDMNLPSGISTTLTRILNSNPGKEYYGLYINNDILGFNFDEAITISKLMILIKYLEDKTINSRNANKVSEIGNWITKLDSAYNAKYNVSLDNGNNSDSINRTSAPIVTPSNKTQYSQSDNLVHTNNTISNSNTSDSIINTNKPDIVKTKDSKTNPISKIRFMEGLNCVHLIDIAEYKGIVNLCSELTNLSKNAYSGYSKYPISSGMLLRSLIEQSFKYHLKKLGHWPLKKKNSNGDPTLGEILGYYRNNQKLLLPDKTISRIFDILFEKDCRVKDILDLSIHHPNIVNITKPQLDSFVDLGIVTFINYLLDK